MKERYLVIGLMACLSGALWFGVRQFMGTTQGLPDTLDIRDVDALDIAAMNATLAAELAEAEENPPPDVQASLAIGPEHDADGEMLDVTTAEEEVPEDPEDDGGAVEGAVEGEGDEGADEEPPERPDSDVDMLARAAQEAPEETVDVEGRDAELERLLAEIDAGLLNGTPPTRAIDLGLPMATLASCPEAAVARFRTGVLFRHGSAGIKGGSLNRIDEVVALRRGCGGGAVHVEMNPQGEADGDAALALRRRDEVKYYLLQRRVPAADILFRARP